MSGEERRQRLVFGEVAATYDRVRPDYPDALVDDVVAAAGLSPGRAALELGAGTGKASRAFAARGVPLVCLEPDGEMAALARHHLAPFPGATVVVTDFEAWDPQGARFPLVFAAQAWHWFDPATRCRRAHDLLADGGLLALFWHRPVWDEDEVRRGLDDVYARVAPQLDAREPGCAGLTAQMEADVFRTELVESGLFGAVEVREYPRSHWRPTADYLDLLSTHSDKRMLDDDTRARFMDEVAALLDAHGGGITEHLLTKLYLARRPSPA